MTGMTFRNSWVDWYIAIGNPCNLADYLYSFLWLLQILDYLHFLKTPTNKQVMTGMTFRNSWVDWYTAIGNPCNLADYLYSFLRLLQILDYLHFLKTPTNEQVMTGILSETLGSPCNLAG